MTPAEFETCYVPVPLRWRYVEPGDVFVGGERLWTVNKINSRQVTVSCGASTGSYDIDPDELVQVLTPVPMAQAVAITREQIGMRLIARRTEQVA